LGENDPFYKEDTYPDNQDVKYKGTVLRNVVFWGPMLDLIYTGHEDLAWQFLDLVWPPQKPGKAIFIRDFKKQLLERQYWKMILEDTGTPIPTTAAPRPMATPAPPAVPTVDMEYPTSGSGRATKEVGLKAYLDPLRVHTLPSGPARYVFAEDRSVFFDDMAGAKIDETESRKIWWKMPAGKYIVYPLVVDEIIFKWW